MAGAPGFEPGIAGPKPAALPLGYAPPHSSIGTARRRHRAALQTAAPAKPARPPSGIARAAAALGYAPPHSSIGTAANRPRAVISTWLRPSAASLIPYARRARARRARAR